MIKENSAEREIHQELSIKCSKEIYGKITDRVNGSVFDLLTSIRCDDEMQHLYIS